MKRIIDTHLISWKNKPYKKSLLLRGARQVGKTYAVRNLGKQFHRFIEVNLETNIKAREIMQQSLDPVWITQQLGILFEQEIIPGATLLFFDEVQAVPQAITALRYFYEVMPALHVVAAGSLVDFAIEKVGIPTGRVSFLYMYPMTFLEFLVEIGHSHWAQILTQHPPSQPFNEVIHNQLLSLVAQYIAIGGMPDAVYKWSNVKTPHIVKEVHTELLGAYKQDFDKYTKSHEIKYVSLIYQKSLEQLSKKFMYSRVGEYKKRELEPALELLEKAGVFCKVFRTTGNGIPIGAGVDLDDFKLILLDVGLTQKLLGLDIVPWFLEPNISFINKGSIVESFVGQEIIAYRDPIEKQELFYWQRNERASQAEVDYLVQLKQEIVPIEVKAGTDRRIKSLHMFLDSHSNSKYGIRFSSMNYEIANRIHNYPLYAVAKPFIDTDQEVFHALNELCKS